MWLENNKKLKRRKKNITVKKKERKKERDALHDRAWQELEQQQQEEWEHWLAQLLEQQQRFVT